MEPEGAMRILRWILLAGPGAQLMEPKKDWLMWVLGGLTVVIFIAWAYALLPVLWQMLRNPFR